MALTFRRVDQVWGLPVQRGGLEWSFEGWDGCLRVRIADSRSAKSHSFTRAAAVALAVDMELDARDYRSLVAQEPRTLLERRLWPRYQQYADRLADLADQVQEVVARLDGERAIGPCGFCDFGGRLIASSESVGEGRRGKGDASVR